LMDQARLVRDDYGANLARVVYGGHHFDHEHKQFQTYYKPKYLKLVR
jgi:hypothetical protein